MATLFSYLRRTMTFAVLSAALIVMVACGDSDDDDSMDTGTGQTTGGNTAGDQMSGGGDVGGGSDGGDDVGGDDDDDGDDDAVQETVNADGTSQFVVPLSAEQEVPPLDIDGATAEGNLIIDKASGAVSGSVAVSGLTGQAQMAHIHTGVAGTNGEVLITLEGNTDGSVWSVPVDGALDSDGLSALALGALYLNVHTSANAGGEIRGQIIPLGLALEDSELSGAEEVPPVETSASGLGISTVNTATGAISATVFTSDLSGNATAAHIHPGAEGVNGAPIITLVQDTGDTSIWRTPEGSILSAEQITAFENEELYFNVHTEANPGGEIRGQL